tara:strand:+ start:34 stop:180 length:147 start_codon:yes stop_codon:yes gene_type:complete
MILINQKEKKRELRFFLYIKTDFNLFKRDTKTKSVGWFFGFFSCYKKG